MTHVDLRDLSDPINDPAQVQKVIFLILRWDSKYVIPFYLRNLGDPYSDLAQVNSLYKTNYQLRKKGIGMSAWFLTQAKGKSFALRLVEHNRDLVRRGIS